MPNARCSVGKVPHESRNRKASFNASKEARPSSQALTSIVIGGCSHYPQTTDLEAPRSRPQFEPLLGAMRRRCHSRLVIGQPDTAFFDQICLFRTLSSTVSDQPGRLSQDNRINVNAKLSSSPNVHEVVYYHVAHSIQAHTSLPAFGIQDTVQRRNDNEHTDQWRLEQHTSTSQYGRNTSRSCIYRKDTCHTGRGR